METKYQKSSGKYFKKRKKGAFTVNYCFQRGNVIKYERGEESGREDIRSDSNNIDTGDNNRAEGISVHGNRRGVILGHIRNKDSDIRHTRKSTEE